MRLIKSINNRWIAFSTHLCISFVIFLVLAAIIRFAWYPGFLFEVDGGVQGIALIAGVDLVIGPLLTLFVFNVAKKELPRDLAIIAMMQLICIFGGMAVVEYSRPIAVVFLDGKYVTVNRYSFGKSDMGADSVQPFISGFGPAWVYIDLPEEQKGMIQAAWSFFGRDIATNVELYEPYENAISVLQKYDASETGGTVELEFAGRYYFGKLVVNTETGDIVNLISQEKY